MFGKILRKLFLCAGFAALLFVSCDMEYIFDPAAEEQKRNERSVGYLTVFNLPGHMSPQKISNVQIHNQVGSIAQCDDYSSVEIEVNDGLSSVKIPLNFNNSAFAETGVYYISFDINIDVNTRYLINKEDRISVSFFNGNGYLDIENIQEASVPYITIKGLPLNTSKHQFTNIKIYNLAGEVANCNNTASISILKNNDTATAMIPVYYSANGEYFQDSGRMILTFTVNVDIENSISFAREDYLTLYFSYGSAAIDLSFPAGLFDAELVNPSDTAAPRIKNGSSFDIDGWLYSVPADTPVNSPLPSSSCALYVYAYRVNNEAVFEYSTQTPSYSKGRGGYYADNKRALWKMLYLVDSGTKFLFKTYIDDQFPQFDTYVASNTISTANFTVSYSLSGAANPAPAAVTLSPGIYLVRCIGAGGGGGSGSVQDGVFSGASQGGQGGIITEVFTLNTATTFTAFTGSGGSRAADPANSGTFSVFTPPYRHSFIFFNFRRGRWWRRSRLFLLFQRRVPCMRRWRRRRVGRLVPNAGRRRWSRRQYRRRRGRRRYGLSSANYDQFLY